LFERVAETGGVAVINADDPAARGMIDYVGASRVLTYSAAGRETDVRATSIDLGPSGTRFTLVTPFGEASVVLPLLGEFNVANALCAAAVATAIEIPLADVVRGLETASPVPGLLEPVDAGQPFKVLVDEAKSATHLTIALEVARRVAAGGRVIVLVGGSDYSSGDELRRKGQVATFVADYAVFTSQDPGLADPNALVAQIAQGAKAVGGRRGKTFACVADRHKAIHHALNAARPGDCVLLVGKGAEDVQRIRGEKRPWDESKIALAALAELGFGTSPYAVGPDIADG
jgi:UDP-N-acetylmuramoyl-L-alanyl-D-glutamate--2,6-diaminopimelate ligase